MIRSQLTPGLEITWREYRSSAIGTGIISGYNKKTQKIEVYVLKLDNSKFTVTNLGLREYRLLDILILDINEALLDELLTDKRINIRELAKSLILKQSETSKPE